MLKRQLYLVAYDITEPSRRAKALKICKGHGLGGQKSVHECWLTDKEQVELKASFELFIDKQTDRFAMIRFAPQTKMHVLGRAKAPAIPPFFYID